MADYIKVIKKVCVFGDPAVGKTSLIQRYVFDVFDNAYYPTIGTKVLKILAEVKREGGKDVLMTLMLWDLLGQSKFEKIHRTYYQGAEGGLGVCDLSRPETITNCENWVKGFKETVGDVPVIILANKVDLVDPKDDSVKRKVMETAQKMGHECLFTSAKANENVATAFHSIADVMAKTIKR